MPPPIIPPLVGRPSESRSIPELEPPGDFVCGDDDLINERIYIEI